MIGGLVSVAAVGIIGAISFKPGPKAPSGEPPTIKAAVEPTKVQPQNPGGAEVPNQNRQILERKPDTKPAETRVVTTEEQPMDVQAAARQAARVVLPGAPATPAAPAAPAMAPTASAPAAPAPGTPPATAAAPPAAAPPAAAPLGEPRRVRTVAIRPDGSVIGQPPAAGAAPAAAPAAPSISTMAPPQATPVAQPPARPATPPPTATPAASPVKTAERISTPAAQTPATPQAAPAARPQPAPAPAQRAAAPAAAETTGGFVVQLGAPGSEAEARTSFAALQRRFPDQLGGRSPVVRKAELADGRTVYRLRVGPLSREGATSLCQSLQANGGSCFIARN
jgi:cell division septation protein DedD